MKIESIDRAEVSAKPIWNALAEVAEDIPLEGAEPWGREVAVKLLSPSGNELAIPCFWAGGRQWRWRFLPEEAGLYRYQIEARGQELEGHGGQLRVEDVGDAAMRWGSRRALRVAPHGRYLEHGDGEPFLWLADSWWFGMSNRLKWEDEFRDLLRDRKKKGFNVIQFAIGLACDIDPFDPRDFNESGGTAWEKDFAAPRPEYFEYTDRRIFAILEEGLIPSIVGAWGYYLRGMGVEKMKIHWRNIIARYGALPVVWTLCGETRLIGYRKGSLHVATGHMSQEEKDETLRRQIDGWTEVARYLRKIDPWQRVLTTHIGPKPGGNDIPELDDLDLLDVHLLQPGHSDRDAVPSTQRDLATVRSRVSGKPIIVGECAFEGMHAAVGPNTQRYLFWSSVLSGMPGYSYGADAIWQMNRPDELFGPSVTGYTWGNNPWQEAMHWDGSRCVGLGSEILRELPWTQFEPRRDWIVDLSNGDPSPFAPYAAGIPGEMRLIYFLRPVPSWGRSVLIRDLEKRVIYDAEFINPIDGSRVPSDPIQGDGDGCFPAPKGPILQDWLLLLRSRKPRSA